MGPAVERPNHTRDDTALVMDVQPTQKVELASSLTRSASGGNRPPLLPKPGSSTNSSSPTTLSRLSVVRNAAASADRPLSPGSYKRLPSLPAHQDSESSSSGDENATSLSNGLPAAPSATSLVDLEHAAPVIKTFVPAPSAPIPVPSPRQQAFSSLATVPENAQRQASVPSSGAARSNNSPAGSPGGHKGSPGGQKGMGGGKLPVSRPASPSQPSMQQWPSMVDRSLPEVKVDIERQESLSDGELDGSPIDVPAVPRRLGKMSGPVPRGPTMSRTKTRSRFGDQRENGMFARKPTLAEKLQGRSGQVRNSGAMKGRSGLLQQEGSTIDEEEQDPFDDVDAPDSWRPEGAMARRFGYFQWSFLLALVIVFFVTLFVPGVRVRMVLGLLFWKWLLLLLVIFSGRLISGWLVRLVVIVVERNFLLRKQVLYFVFALRGSVQNIVWLALVVGIWFSLINPRVADDNSNLRFVSRALICALVAAVLVLLKVLLVKVLASRFHVARFFERIQESLFHQYVLETMSAPPALDWESVQDVDLTFTGPKHESRGDKESLMRSQTKRVRQSGPMGGRSPSTRNKGGTPKSGEGGADGEVKKGSQIPIDKLQQLTTQTVSAWSMKRLMQTVRYQGISTYTGMLETGEEIDSELAAKAAAKQIFRNVAAPGSRYIGEKDLRRFFTAEQVENIWPLFQGALELGHISKKALQSWVLTVYQERRSLALTLNDTKTVVKKLHRVLDVVLWVIILVIWAMILGYATTQTLVASSTLLISFAFVFGNSLKNTFESIIFLFVMHPFDVGDRIEIWENNEKTQMVVEEMNLMNTLFLRADNGRVYLPNTVLSQKTIVNIGRSPDMGEAIDFYVNVGTSGEKIAELRERVKAYLTSLPNHWYPNFFLILRDMDEMQRLKVSLWCSHTMNHQQAGERFARRAALLGHVIKSMVELGIAFQLPTQEIKISSTSLPMPGV